MKGGERKRSTVRTEFNDSHHSAAYESYYYWF